MPNLILIAIVGFAAQLVDGSLGMAYGVTSTTLLAVVGLSPALASASVHLSEVGTTLVAGISHWRFGNVDWKGIGWLAIPGGIAAFLGAVVLTSLSAEAAAPVVSVILLGLGIYILVRFIVGRSEKITAQRRVPNFLLVPLGLIAGFIDALGGGGWGPVATPTLITAQHAEPRKVIGTVDTSEFIVALAASIGFLLTLNIADIPVGVVLALLIGGILAAPLAAWLVRIVNPRILGTAVGGLIILTNVRTLLRAIRIEDVRLEDTIGLPVYVLIAVIWAAAIGYAIYLISRDRKPTIDTGAIQEA